MKRAVAAAAIAAIFVALAWVASWSSVRALLADDALRRTSAWSEGRTPWRWSLASPEAVIWPGSTGLQRETDLAGGVLLGTVPDGNADLSLELHGEAVDLSVVGGLLVALHGSTPVRLSVLGERDGTVVPLSPVIEAANELAYVPFDRALQFTSRRLRLHLEVAPAARVGLGTLALVPREAMSPQPCEHIEACRAGVPLVAPPAALFPETALAWRDGVMRTRPAAIVDVDARHAAPLRAILARASDPAVSWLLLLAPIAVGLASRFRQAPSTRGVAAMELLLLFSPWLVLQWAGVPGDGQPDRAGWAALGGALGALVSRPVEGWQRLGDAAAWRALVPFALAALATLAIVAAAAGFETRPLAASKAWQYPLWALLQQWILMQAIAPRMRTIAGAERGGAWLSGALFGLLHLPNLALMIATFAAGTYWARHGYRHRALLPLVVAHAASGLALMWLAPPWLVRSAEVGARYLMAP